VTVLLLRMKLSMSCDLEDFVSWCSVNSSLKVRGIEQEAVQWSGHLDARLFLWMSVESLNSNNYNMLFSTGKP